MLPGRTRASADATRRFLRCGMLIAGAVVFLLAVGGAHASAAPLEETTDAAGSVVAPITEASSPALPSTPPPPTPSAPVATPTVPPPVDQVPTPQPPSHLTPTPSDGTAEPSDRSAELPSVDGTTPTAKELAGGGVVTSPGAPPRAAPSARGEVGAGSNGPGGSSRPAPIPAVGIAPSVEAIVLPHWLAYVWPAIALGRTGKVLAVLLATWRGATSFPMSEAVSSLFRSIGDVEGHGVAAITERSSPPTSRSVAHPTAPAPIDAGMSLLLTVVTSLLALMALVALARLVVGDEFFSFLRWPH
jgi:hypothetical protein